MPATQSQESPKRDNKHKTPDFSRIRNSVRNSRRADMPTANSKSSESSLEKTQIFEIVNEGIRESKSTSQLS